MSHSGDVFVAAIEDVSNSGGMYSGSKTGAGVGFMSGVFNLITNPEGFCFVAGTVVMTAVGLVAIEDLQPGDVVYSMVAAGEEQQVDLSQELDRKVILETYAHEVDETYVVTIDGESIEATPEHPFYNVDGEEVQAKDLKEGDELATANGDTATVDSVECIHHDEPVMVYNIAVCDSHTYFVGENHVLVHNMCPPKSDGENTANSQSPLRDIYNSIKESPKYPDGFEAIPNGTTRNNINNRELLEKLRDIESGTWKKVYKDGFDSFGNEVSIHYFQSQSGKVFDVKVKPGWSN